MKNKLLFILLGACASISLTNCNNTSDITTEDNSSLESESISSSSDENSSNLSSTEEVDETKSFNLLGEDYSKIKNIKDVKNTTNNWNDLYSDSDKIKNSGDVTYSETYKNNILQNGETAINSDDDVKNIFYNGLDSARFVSNADGYALTIPTATTLETDFSLGLYRSKLYNDNFTITISYEHSNPYNNWDTYREEWLFRYLDNANYYEQNNLLRTHDAKQNETKFLRGYYVDQFDLVINNPGQIEKNYYSVAAIRELGNIKDFVLIVLKSTEDTFERMESIIKSYKKIMKQGKANNNSINSLPVSYDSNWSEETRNYYELLLTQERTGWGFFTACIPDGRMTLSQMKTSDAYVKLNELSQAFDYNFDIIPTYQHIGWYRQANNRWPVTAAKNMAGGNGYNGLPVIQMSYQFTDNNNNVSVANTTDCYTPMFDIYRGAKENDDTYYPSVETKYENALRELAKDIKDYGKPVLFRLNNEMNTDWTSYCGLMTLVDPDIFTATWRILYNIFIEEGVDNCIWIFNPIAVTCPYSSWGEDMCYYPGLEYVNALGLTYYEDNNNNNVNYNTFRKDYTALYEKNNPVWQNYPWIISEFGCGSGGDASGKLYRNQASQVQYIEGMFNDFNDRSNNKYLQNIKGAVWFSVNDYGSNNTVINQYEIVVSELTNTVSAIKKGLAANK